MKVKKITFFIVLISLVLAVIYYCYGDMIRIATAYGAKKVCNCALIGNRELDEIVSSELNFSVLPYLSHNINKETNEVNTSFWGLFTSKCKYENSLGCIRIKNEDDCTRHHNLSEPLQLDSKNESLIISYDTAVQTYLKNLVTVENNTHAAILVLKNDTIIGEVYKLPFSQTMPILGWSMTKSWMNAMIGLLIKDGKITLKSNSLFSEWDGDTRRNITVQNLLQMNSGLEWEEEYSEVSNATKMLYLDESIIEQPIQSSLKYNNGEEWYYSSGTSNLLSILARRTINDDQEYANFLNKRLFSPLGMYSAFIETDECGNFIMSSYGYATARDWAKFGLLYLHDGLINGVEILPKSWIEFTKETAIGSDGLYGAHFWLNTNNGAYSDAPADLISADGFLGQNVFIIPSENMVIVRLGTSDKGYNPNEIIKKVIERINYAIWLER